MIHRPVRKPWEAHPSHSETRDTTNRRVQVRGQWQEGYVSVAWGRGAHQGSGGRGRRVTGAVGEVFRRQLAGGFHRPSQSTDTPTHMHVHPLLCMHSPHHMHAHPGS